MAAAYHILSDADKRAGYDRYGETEGNTGGGTTADTRRAQAYAHYEQEVSPEDLFNMFFGFGGGMPGGARMGHTVFTSDGRVFRGGMGGGGNARRPRTPEEADNAAAGQRMASLLQLVPLVLMVVFMLFSFSGSGDGRADPWYSLTETQDYRIERRTSSPHVTPHLPFFVKDDFVTRIRNDRRMLERIEAAVESDMFTQLQAKCSQENSKRRVLQQQIAGAGDDRKRSALQSALRSFATPGCDAFKSYFPAHAT